MKQTANSKFKTIRILSIFVALLGIILLIFMIKSEDEPGALPLFLILLGTAGYFITRHQIKKASKNIEQ